MSDWIKRLEDTWGGMTPNTWTDHEYTCGCCSYIQARDSKDKLMYSVGGHGAISPMDAAGIVSLANLRHELLALVRAANYAVDPGIGCGCVGYCGCYSEHSHEFARDNLDAALTALRAKVEGEG